MVEMLNIMFINFLLPKPIINCITSVCFMVCVCACVRVYVGGVFARSLVLRVCACVCVCVCACVGIISTTFTNHVLTDISKCAEFVLCILRLENVYR